MDEMNQFCDFMEKVSANNSLALSSFLPRALILLNVLLCLSFGRAAAEGFSPTAARHRSWTCPTGPQLAPKIDGLSKKISIVW
jgi:hypothetical protein